MPDLSQNYFKQQANNIYPEINCVRVLRWSYFVDKYSTKIINRINLEVYKL